jgi:hypothetical protein
MSTGKPIIHLKNHRNATIEGLRLEGLGASDAGSVGLRISGTSEYTILRDLSITDCYTGIFIGDGSGAQGGNAGIKLYNVGIDKCTYAMQSDNSQQDSYDFAAR